MFVDDASYFSRRTIFESDAWVACISGKTNDDRYDSRFQVFTGSTWALPGRSEAHRCTYFQLRVCQYEKCAAGQTKFYVGDVCNMMSVSAEGAERLVEIFREMLALSETSRANHSQSAVPDESIELFDTHGPSGTTEGCAVQGKHTSNESREC
jgi:hypothetical protein